jgi:hypothetical protein
VHNATLVKINDLMKELIRYNEELHKKHKQIKGIKVIGSIFLPQCGPGSGSRVPNQYGSGFWSDFAVTKS